jgi:hypothetical protein
VLEEEFGDIKEPKLTIHYLLIAWFTIGMIVSYLEFKKYYRKLKIKRDGIDYSKSIYELFIKK